MAEDAQERSVTACSYYAGVLSRAFRDTLALIGRHLLFAVLVLLATYGVGAATGLAVNAETVTTVVLYPLAALIAVAVGVFGYELALAPVRLARDKAKEVARLSGEGAQRRQLPPTPLEDWLEGRLAEQTSLKRQRRVRGDAWYFRVMNQWDFENFQQLTLGDRPIAPDLVDGYRRDPRTGNTDGTPVDGNAQDTEDTFDRRVDWLHRTLDDLRADDTDAVLRSTPLVHDLRWHLHKGRSLQARVYSASFAAAPLLAAEIETWTQQAHNRLRERPDLAERFLDAHPGFTSANALDQSVDAREMITARLASLEEIIAELGCDGQRSLSGDPPG